MNLPSALAPWSAPLSIFPLPLALALGPMIQRLDLAIGPLSSGSSPGAGEPDGLSGISRRGSYERLLLSEWLLADEVPDEFLRRAAGAEHSFLELARREPKTERISVLLLDAGPSQWGSPRLAHLAALVVFARRAEAAGATFMWGVLQDPQVFLEGQFSPGALRRFLQARTTLEVDEETVGQWRRLLGEFLSGLENQVEPDLWVVGGARLAGHLEAHRLAHLEVKDVLEPDTRELDTTVIRAGRRTELRLPLPEPAACTRLLRDPFQMAAAAPVPHASDFAPVSNLLFVGERKLAALDASGALVVHSIPNSPRDQAGRPRRYPPPPGHQIISAGRVGKVIVGAVTAGLGKTVRIIPLDGKRLPISPSTLEIPEHVAVAPAPGTPLGVCARSPSYGTGFCLEVADRIVYLEARESAGLQEWTLRAASVVEVVPLHRGVMVAYTDHPPDITQDDAWGLLTIPEDTGYRPELHRDAPGPRAFFGCGPEFSLRYALLVALEQQSGEWQVVTEAGVVRMSPPAGSEVVGVAPIEGVGAGLVLVGETRRSLSIWRPNCQVLLPSAPAEIRHVSVSPWAVQIAYATTRGDLLVYSLTHQALLYHFIAEDRS